MIVDKHVRHIKGDWQSGSGTGSGMFIRGQTKGPTQLTV